MGLFNSYLKPGPGVEKDAPKKKGIFLYFELLFRKFFKIMQANMLYFIVSIPMILIIYVLSPVSMLTNNLSLISSDLNPEEVMHFSHTLRCMSAMLILTFIGSGPASAAYAYIMRCITREEHAWIWSDFFQKFKENFKQSIIVIIIDLIALPLMLNAIFYYFQLYASTNKMMFGVLLYVTCLASLVYLFMHIYIYQLMVTYECKIRALYKNSFLLAVAKLPMNILLFAISLFLAYVSFSYLEATFVMFLFFLLLYSLVRFPMEFYSARTVMRLILNTPEGDNE